MKLSAVIITLNEARNIERCLKSLDGVVDEVVVIDSFSTDDTEILSRKYGANFVQKEWMGYSATKNYGHKLARNQMILSIDADESLSDELRKSILKIPDNMDDQVFSFNRLTNYCGSWVKHCGWYPDVKIRIFHKTLRWTGEIHEKLELGNREVVHLVGDLFHYSYYNQKEHRERADKYSALTARKMYENGKQAGLMKPLISGVAKFLSIYILKFGFLDGKAGWNIARISAASNVHKYRELRRLNRSNGQ